MSDRVTRRILDIATSADEVEPADVVTGTGWCAAIRYELQASAAVQPAVRFLALSPPAEGPLHIEISISVRSLAVNTQKAPPESCRQRS
jgi:hypothetical protein